MTSDTDIGSEAKPAGRPPQPPYGTRVYSDGRKAGFKQGWVSYLVAVSTLTLYTAWIPMLMLLFLFVWNRTVLFFLLALFSTLGIPAKLHWQEFIDGYLLQTWREYFNFSYIIEGQHPLLQNQPFPLLRRLSLSAPWPSIQQGSHCLSPPPHNPPPLHPLISASSLLPVVFGKQGASARRKTTSWPSSRTVPSPSGPSSPRGLSRSAFTRSASTALPPPCSAGSRVTTTL